CAIYVDMGTTNTRVWLMRGSEILAHVNKQVGVRDSARERSNASLRGALRELLVTVQQQANDSAGSVTPVCVIAAGMIGSPLGLAEVAHVPAPASLLELVAGTSRFEYPEVTALPILLVPGVRCG